MNETTHNLPSSSPRFSFLANRLCLDFANTVSNRGTTTPVDRIGSYNDLLAWAIVSGSLDEQSASLLVIESMDSPSQSGRVLNRARKLRECIFRLFFSLARGKECHADDVECLNSFASRAFPHERVAAAKSSYTVTWDPPNHLERPLWPIIRSAFDLLTTGRLDRIGCCADEPCRWLYYDTTRNRSRKWCDMSDCGNRVKARRYYQRSRKVKR